MTRFAAGLFGALTVASAAGCSCAPTGIGDTTFSCTEDTDCLDGFSCRDAVCARVPDGGFADGLVLVQPTTGLVTSEGGTTATFVLSLGSQPTANVTIDLVSSDPGEGSVSPATLVFTPVNWAGRQTVTVVGVDDTSPDGPQRFAIVTTARDCDDPHFHRVAVEDVEATNTDNDSAGVTVPLTTQRTSEFGAVVVFPVVLNAAPSADVIIDLESSDLTEGTVSPASLTFTPVNWASPQGVSVTGVDDPVPDGPQLFHVVTTARASDDPNYSGIEVADVAVQNVDDDSAGVEVTPVSGLLTTEAGGQASFTIVLLSEPRANVTIGLASSDPTEALVAPASLTFTPVNWNAPQPVTVTGVDDALIDGNVTFLVTTSQPTSTDPAWATVAVPDVSVTNVDDETAGVTVTPTSGLVTTEAGGTATFTVVLNAQPAARVTLTASTSDATEGTVSPASLAFEASTWNVPQTVTVTGVDDALLDGDQPYTVVTSPLSSTDPNYLGLAVPDVAVTNTDNDSAGFTVTPTLGLVTTEAGGTATFRVVLNAQPTTTVTVALSSNNITEGTVAPASLQFTTTTWNTPQTVTVTGVDDSVQDGNQPFTIVTAPATSGDPNYAGLNPSDVAVTNNDNDTAGFTISPTTSLTTSEAGGVASFTVVLKTRPLADVFLGLTSSNPAEGQVSPALLTFTPATWNTPRTVTLTGVDDRLVDGPRGYTITTSSSWSTDPNYRLEVADVSATNTDNDTPGVDVTPTSGLVVTERGTTATFSLVLNTPPAANVTIDLTSTDVSEGTVSPSTVTFTPATWNTPRVATITGADDATSDGVVAFTISTSAASSGDVAFNGRAVADVAVTNIDDETPSVVVTPAVGLTTTETGGTATFSVFLSRAPTADVVINLTSGDLTEATVTPAQLTFTPSTWATPQVVTARGVSDAEQDGATAFTIVTDRTLSAELAFDNRPVADVSGTNLEMTGVVVSPREGLVTSESGLTQAFTVVLEQQPTSDVTVDLASNDVGEGTVAPGSVVFTSANWNTPQQVTITGVDDRVIDGARPFTIVTGAAASADLNFNARAVADVSVSNSDNDSAGATVTPTAGLTTSEAGTTASFSVVLNAQPTASVSIGLTSSDLSEGTVSPPSLTFTPANWSTPQLVTITGVNDPTTDGPIDFLIVTGAATSGDANYHGVTVPDVVVTNLDDD